jgi:hypothetical protein
MTKFILEGLLPAPSEDASVKTILEFRAKHEEELLRFRRAIREFIQSLEGLSEEQLLERLDAQKDDVREQSLMLGRKLKENRLGTALSVVEVSVPAKAEGLAALISLPIGAVVGGINAAVKIGRQVFEGRREAQLTPRREPVHLRLSDPHAALIRVGAVSGSTP